MLAFLSEFKEKANTKSVSFFKFSNATKREILMSRHFKKDEFDMIYKIYNEFGLKKQ